LRSFFILDELVSLQRACFDAVGCGVKLAAAAGAARVAAVTLLLMAMTTNQHLRKQCARRGLQEEDQLEPGAA
jgi:hypothetical protein